jgi:hypothetical protein
MNFFSINKDHYDDIPATNKEAFTAESVFQVQMVLPFSIPMEDDAIFVKSGVNYHVIFLFKRIDYSRSFEQNLPVLPFYRHPNKAALTYVELAYISAKKMHDDVNIKNDSSSIMNKLMVEINELLVGLSYQTLSPNIHRVTRPMLNNATYFRVFGIDDWDNNMVGFLTINFTAIVAKEPNNLTPLDIETLHEIISYSRQKLRISENFALDALRHYTLGLNKESVINIQTAVESFLYTIYIMNLVVGGLSEKEAFMKADKLALKNLINHGHLEFITGCEWKTDDMNHICGKWYQTSYAMRNKIVHAGYEPSGPKAREAIETALVFREHVFRNLLQLVGSHEALANSVSLFYMQGHQTFAYSTFMNNIAFAPPLTGEEQRSLYDKFMDTRSPSE